MDKISSQSLIHGDLKAEHSKAIDEKSLKLHNCIAY